MTSGGAALTVLPWLLRGAVNPFQLGGWSHGPCMELTLVDLLVVARLVVMLNQGGGVSSYHKLTTNGKRSIFETR